MLAPVLAAAAPLGISSPVHDVTAFPAGDTTPHVAFEYL
jgi:hypothetical protein